MSSVFYLKGNKVKSVANIYFFSGPCGCGKTTLSKAFAKYIVNGDSVNQVYIIHGDDFHAGFVDSDNDKTFLSWNGILKFNWDCILSIAKKAMDRGVDVVIDYVIEDELPLVRNLAKEYNANLYYVVLTATENIIRQRITERGDVELIERALFLKNKLDTMQENQSHLFDNTGMTVEEELQQLQINNFIVK